MPYMVQKHQTCTSYSNNDFLSGRVIFTVKLNYAKILFIFVSLGTCIRKFNELIDKKSLCRKSIINI